MTYKKISPVPGRDLNSKPREKQANAVPASECYSIEPSDYFVNMQHSGIITHIVYRFGELNIVLTTVFAPVYIDMTANTKHSSTPNLHIAHLITPLGTLLRAL